MTTVPEAIVIGGSAGALDALQAILPALPRSFGLPVVVVLHVVPGRPSGLVNVLRSSSLLVVKEVEDKEPLVGGTIHVAPPSYHVLVEGDRTLALSVDEPVHFSRPSIDVLFESAVDVFGAGLVGVLLSGANEDGARGLAKVKRAGGTTIVQAPATAPSRQMPDSALRLFTPDHLLDASLIGPLLADTGHPHALPRLAAEDRQP